MNLWLVGRSFKGPGPWAFEGVYSTRALALARAAALEDETVFLGPAVLDEDITSDVVIWPNAEFPNRLRRFVRRGPADEGDIRTRLEHSDDPALEGWYAVPPHLAERARAALGEP